MQRIITSIQVAHQNVPRDKHTMTIHRRRKVLNIGGGRGQVSNYGGGGGGGSKVVFVGCKLIGAPAPNQCQIITFLTLKTDNIAKLRIELKVYF